MTGIRVESREASGPRTCVYCRDPVEAPTVCERCDATYHADCRAELGRCATPGCVGDVRRVVPRPEFSEHWRTTAERAQAEWIQTRIREEDARAAAQAAARANRRQLRVGSDATSTPVAVLWAGAGLVFVALLALTLLAFGRAGVLFDQSIMAGPLGVLTGPAAVVVALRAIGGEHPAARRGGWAMLLTIGGGAALALRLDEWYHLPLWVFLAAFVSLVVGALVGGDEPVPPRS